VDETTNTREVNIDKATAPKTSSEGDSFLDLKAKTVHVPVNIASRKNMKITCNTGFHTTIRIAIIMIVTVGSKLIEEILRLIVLIVESDPRITTTEKMRVSKKPIISISPVNAKPIPNNTATIPIAVKPCSLGSLNPIFCNKL
jgi:hypothetical protein